MSDGSPRVERVERCPSCGAEGTPLYPRARDRLFGVPGEWGVAVCHACGLAWLDPRPVPDDIGKLYANYFTHGDASAPEREGRAALKRALVSRTCGYADGGEGGVRLAAGILSALGPVREIAEGSVMWLEASRQGRVLDVGSGNGAFLQEMRRLGWEAVGVEPDPEAARTSRERFGLDVRTGTLEDAGLEDDWFDAVTMSHVIEHVPDPAATLRECARVLRPGGRLVVVTPNTQSLGRRWFGASWIGWDPPRHLVLFTPSLLRGFAERAGLRVLGLRTTARGARYMWSASRLLARRGELPGARPEPLPLHVRIEATAFWLVEWLAARIAPRGEEILLVATTDDG